MPHSAKYSRKVAKYKFLQKFSELSRKIDYDTIIIIEYKFLGFRNVISAVYAARLTHEFSRLHNHDVLYKP